MKKIMTLCFVLIFVLIGCGKEEVTTTIDETQSSPYVVKDFVIPEDESLDTLNPEEEAMLMKEFEFSKGVNDAVLSTASTVDELSLYMNTIDDSTSVADLQLNVEIKLDAIREALNAVPVIDNYPEGRTFSEYMPMFEQDRLALLASLDNYSNASVNVDLETMWVMLSPQGELYKSTDTFLNNATYIFYPVASDFMERMIALYS